MYCPCGARVSMRAVAATVYLALGASGLRAGLGLSHHGPRPHDGTATRPARGAHATSLVGTWASRRGPWHTRSTALVMQESAGTGGIDDPIRRDLDLESPGARTRLDAQPSAFAEGMPRLNSVVLTGRLGQDPKPRYFDNGNVVLNLGLAVTRQYHALERSARSIKWGEEETDWFQLEIWNWEAERVAKTVRKGTRVGVEGSLAISTWTDNEGNPRTSPRILVDKLEVLESKSEALAREDNSEANLWDSERQQRQPYRARQEGQSKPPTPPPAAARTTAPPPAPASGTSNANAGAGAAGGSGSLWSSSDDAGADASGDDPLPSFFDNY